MHSWSCSDHGRLFQFHQRQRSVFANKCRFVPQVGQQQWDGPFAFVELAHQGCRFSAHVLIGILKRFGEQLTCILITKVLDLIPEGGDGCRADLGMG